MTTPNIINIIANQTGSSVNPITLGEFWENGLTQTIYSGSPPATWALGVDGFYYPPGILPTNTVQPVIISAIPNTISTQILFDVFIDVLALPNSVSLAYPIVFDVSPNVPQFTENIRDIPTTVTLIPIAIPLTQAILTEFNFLGLPQLENYFDITREGKTLLNFGLDYQALITNWKFDNDDPTLSTIDVKLYKPLPTQVSEKTQLWIAREITPSVIDRIYVRNTPIPPPPVYLRPANRDITLTGQTGQTVQNVTLGTLLSSGSFQTPYPSDPVIQQWYTSDVNSADLNINYADYREFITYGSAASRLTAFINKLLLLENYNSIISLNSSSLATISFSPTGALAYPSLLNIAEQKIDLFRTFDGYERFLYYKSGISYSSSLSTDDDNDDIYYISDCTYPKISGSVIPVASASAWINAQSVIANAYDQQSVTSLEFSIPQYIQNDINSQDYITFINLIGHHIDNIKVYIDHMKDTYDRQSDPTQGLSEDLIWNVAQGFGIDLPNQYAINNLVDYTIGDITQPTPKIYHEVAAEVWKRFLHNQIYMMKSKGTKTSLRALANSYGILPTTLQIREGSNIAPSYTSGTFETFQQQTNALNFITSSYIQIPWAARTDISSSTIELRFSTTNNSATSVIAQADSLWGVRLQPLSSSYGSIIVTGSNGGVVSSSNLPIYSGDFYSVMIQNNNDKIGLYVKHANQENIDYFSTTFESQSLIANTWYSANNLYIGSSGSLFGNGFIGQMDEVRIWSEELNEKIFEDHTLYPGLYNGNIETSALDNLIVRLSFSIPTNLFLSSSIYNESPYNPAQTFSAKGFPNISTFPYNTSIILRNVTRYTPNAGNQFTTNKITIAPPAIVNTSLNVSSSVVSRVTKQESNNGNSNLVGFYFSLTDAINDSIIRSIGNIDLQNLIGDPADQFNSYYSDLLNLDNLYWSEYAYTFNQNQFIEFVRNLLEPLFKQAKSLVPVRTKLISGIVHEPHMLERSKIPAKPLKLTRNNFVGYVGSTQPANISGSSNNFSSVLKVQKTTKPAGTYLNLTDELDIDSTSVIQGLYQNKDSVITAEEIINTQGTFTSLYGITATCKPVKVKSDYSTYSTSENLTNPSINIYSDYMQQSSITLGNSTIPNIIYPLCNLKDLAATTYFNNIYGFIGEDQIVYVMNNANILNNRGTWTSGNSYNRFDYVADAVQGSPGSGSLFQFSPRSGISQIDPYYDTQNWQPVTYTADINIEPRLAVLISGSVSLLPTTSMLTPIHEYLPEHYLFHHDTCTGTLRHTRFGCLQTNLSTLDGSSPIQTIPTSTNKLIVVGGTNLQQNTGVTGPILNVT